MIERGHSERWPKALLVDVASALLVAIAIVAFIDWLTSSMAPAWDGIFYLDMAKNGVVGNTKLVAPFAYRPGTPVLVRLVATATHRSFEASFHAISRVASVVFLLAVFAAARTFVDRYRFRHALWVMAASSLAFVHVKFPLFFYSLVDVVAYPLMVAATWALLSQRTRTCIAIASVGVFFKEFLAVPLVIAVVQLSYRAYRERSRNALVAASVAVVVSASVIVLPRVLLKVSSSQQFVGPINNPTTLRPLLVAFDLRRVLNVILAFAGYWLPTLALMTRPRFYVVWDGLGRAGRRALGATLVLVALLTMYGGTNIAIFASYSVGAQVIVLALLLREGSVSLFERIYVLVVLVVFNRIGLDVPDPGKDYTSYIDTFGPFDTNVNMMSIVRFLLIVTFVTGARWSRIVVAKSLAIPPP